MAKTISLTSKKTTQSIVILQGAYEQYCVAAQTSPTVYSSPDTDLFGFLLTAEQSTALATNPPVEDWLRFQQLVAEWRAQRGAMSSITEAVICPAYQSIIGMGELAVPFILAQLDSEGDEPDQWFWALKAITGAEPVKDEDRGNYINMAASWFDWAKNVGYGW